MPISPSKSRDLVDGNNKILTEWKWFETTLLNIIASNHNYFQKIVICQSISIRRKKNPQTLNVLFLVKNRRNFAPQKLSVIRYSNLFVLFITQFLKSMQAIKNQMNEKKSFWILYNVTYNKVESCYLKVHGTVENIWLLRNSTKGDQGIT
jgi:hypothetical protein